MQFVNAYQTPETRRRKYKLVRDANINYDLARRMRDWTWPHIENFIEYEKKEKVKKK